MRLQAKDKFKKVLTAMRSRRGQNFFVFLAFLILSTILWFVMTLNDVVQSDINMPFQLTNIPDSVTLVSTPPSQISVSMRAEGTQRLKLTLGSSPTLSIDFREFQNGKSVRLSSTDIKNAARNALGGTTINFVMPDSLNIAYTSSPGEMLPIAVNYKVNADRQFAVNQPVISADSVRVFTADDNPSPVSVIYTEPIRYNGIKETISRRVRLMAPAGTRVIPDSIDVTFKVDPLILKTRQIVVEAVNVPEGCKLITFPAKVEVRYMIPMGEYANSDPKLRVIADYSTIDAGTNSHNIGLIVSDIPAQLQNVRLATDSVEYIIEKL